MRIATWTLGALLIVRPGADDLEHRAAAQSSEFDAVVAVRCDDRPGGTGTIIHDRWLLTAAHVALQCEPQRISVVAGERTLSVDASLVHPNFERGPHAFDVALLLLSTPETKIRPLRRSEVTLSVGDTVTMVGFGVGGPTGNEGAAKRLATNVIDLLGTNARGEQVPGWEVGIDFDDGRTRGTNRTGDVVPTPMEGIPSGGDSGGPWLTRHRGLWEVSAVYHTSQYDVGGLLATPPRFGGTVAYATETTHANRWIDSILQSPPLCRRCRD